MPLKIIFLIFSFLCVIPCYAYEHPRYEIDARIDTAGHTIKAGQKVIFTNNTKNEIKEIFFHLYPRRNYTSKEKNFMLRYAAYFKVNPFPEGFQAGDLQIKSIHKDNQALKYSIEGADRTLLRVELESSLMPQETVSIDMDYEVRVPHSYGRFGWHNNITSLLRWYPILCVYDDEGCHAYPFYPYHQPYYSESAVYSVSLTVGQDQVVVHSGTISEQRPNSDGTKTLNIVSKLPLRDFGITLSPDFKVFSKNAGNAKVNSYYLPGDEFYGRKALDFAIDLINYNNKHYLEYPFEEFSISPSYLGYGGTQSSNLALIDSRVYRLPKFLIRYFDFLISHEASHQWFYNIVGSDEYKEMFIDEGFNSYATLQHLENKYGQNAEILLLPKALEWLIPNFSFSRARLDRYSFIAKNKLDRPVLGELSSFQEPSSIFSITYGKGSKIVEMLKYVMGEDAFRRLVSRYFEEFKFKNISVRDLEKIASQESKSDLNYFFNQWLNSAKKCDYAVKAVQGKKIYLINNGGIVMPQIIRVKTGDGRISEFFWDGRNKEKELTIDSESKIVSVQIDPEGRILDLDRTNNYWKRRIEFKAVPLYYPVYEIPVFLNPEAFNVIAGPVVSGSEIGIKASMQKPQDYILYGSTTYNNSEERVKSTLGFQFKHLAPRLTKAGIEAFNYNGANGGTDQRGLKLYLRKELWPVSYGLLDENDHITFYVLRARDFKSTLATGIFEDIRSLYYRQQDEAILGLNFKAGRYGPYPDVFGGWKFKAVVENAQHFWGGDTYFWRFSPEWTNYFSIKAKNIFAIRAKIGIGYHSDKSLFQLGGEKGLRGFAYKTINGSQAVMFNFEYRRDLIDNLNLAFFDNIVTLNKIQAVGFFDAGKSWFASFRDKDFKKDAGIGLRLHFTVGSFLERLILRVDAAKPINEPKAKSRFWVGVNHVF